MLRVKCTVVWGVEAAIALGLGAAAVAAAGVPTRPRVVALSPYGELWAEARAGKVVPASELVLLRGTEKTEKTDKEVARKSFPVPFTSLAFSSNGEWLAAANSKHQVLLFRVNGAETFKTAGRPLMATGPVASLNFSHDNNQLRYVTGNRVQFLVLSPAKVEGGKGMQGEAKIVLEPPPRPEGPRLVVEEFPTQFRRPSDVKNKIAALAFGDSEDVLFTSFNNAFFHWTSVRREDREPHKEQTYGILEGQLHEIYTLLPMGKGHVLSAGKDKTVTYRKLGTQTFKPIFRCTEPVLALVRSPNPKSPELVVGGMDRKIHFVPYNSETLGKEELRAERSVSVTDTVFALAFDAEGKQLAAACLDGSVRVFDMARPDAPKRIYRNPGNQVHALVFLDADRLLWGGKDGKLYTAHIGRDAKALVPIDSRHKEITSLVFHAKSGLVISGGLDDKIRFWKVVPDYENAKQVPLVPPPAEVAESTTMGVNGVRSLLLSRDGRMLITGGMDGALKRWHISSPRH